MDRKQRLRLGREVLDSRYQKVGSLTIPALIAGSLQAGGTTVPPLSIVERLDGPLEDQINLRKLPACQECNSIPRSGETRPYPRSPQMGAGASN